MLRVYEMMPDETNPPKLKFEIEFKASKTAYENNSIAQNGKNILVHHNATTYILEVKSFQLLKTLDETLLAFNSQHLILQNPQTHGLFLRDFSDLAEIKL